MAIRASSVDAIAKLRLLIGDRASATQQFSEQQLQDALDRVRQEVRYEVLRPYATYTPTGIQYRDFYSSWGYFESDVTLLDGGYNTITPSTSELLLDNAHWTFALGQGQYPPVFALGKAFDIYRAAADLLEYWAAAGAADFAFSADGGSFHPEQVAQARLKLAQMYRAKQRPIVVQMVRDDVDTAADAHEADPRRANLGPVSKDVPFITGD